MVRAPWLDYRRWVIYGRTQVDCCIVGHVTRDRVLVPGQPPRDLPGGTAYYAALALRRLGLEVAVITKAAERDWEELLGPLRDAGVEVWPQPSARTTCFENTYLDATLRVREQRVHGVADPFTLEDLEGVRARSFYLGPLTGKEIPLEVLEEVRHCAELLLLDGQGWLRKVVQRVGEEGARVEQSSWAEAERALMLTDVLKVDDTEASLLVGTSEPRRAAELLESRGVGEVLITFADRGSWVRSQGRNALIPALPPPATVDATGCGDTYAAGYLAERLRGAQPLEAAWFAAALSSLKLTHFGPFTGTAEAARAHLEAHRGGRRRAVGA